jgi:hypothetical protein
MATVPRLQRQILVPDIPVLLQPFQHGLIGLDILERAKLTDRFAEHFASGKTQQFGQERVYIVYAAPFSVQNQYAILRRLE